MSVNQILPHVLMEIRRDPSRLSKRSGFVSGISSSQNK